MITKQTDVAEMGGKNLVERLTAFRISKGMSRAALAAKLGITPVTLYRWETGSTKPSPLATEKLQEIGFGPVLTHETNVNSVPRLRPNKTANKDKHAQELREASKRNLKNKFYNFNIYPSPFVSNGPLDQSKFHDILLDLQISSPTLTASKLARRLSLVEEVENFGFTTQHLLEKPKKTAVSWNSNYGSHGWHRYVGRFPAHVIRAILNYFGADKDSVVCDPFAGSGTTAVECRLLGIPFVGIEICPLSCMMIRTKAAFPADPSLLKTISETFIKFYQEKWESFLKGQNPDQFTYNELLAREGNLIPTFVNIERWFTKEALLGTSIAVEFGMGKKGFEREALLLALSAKMRSIGNVDVDVVRAEFSKKPRSNVNVGQLVSRQLLKMSANINDMLKTHNGLIGSSSSMTLFEESVLDVSLANESVNYIITSPPYGIEAISYLRTHLLSYRSLVSHLGHDPYTTRDKTIGSEYVNDKIVNTEHVAGTFSSTCRAFFESNIGLKDAKYVSRRAAMIQFFDDMYWVGKRMSDWLKDEGKVAFIIGNKRLGEAIVPMDTIVTELFSSCDLSFVTSISHKLKTNNSNSQVPWQERIIQEESILIFQRKRRSR